MGSSGGLISSSSSGLYLNEKRKMSKNKEGSRSVRSTSGLSSSSSSNSFSACNSFKGNTTSNKRPCALARKCVRLVREQRARFYIMRRCVTMLICWRDYTDS